MLKLHQDLVILFIELHMQMIPGIDEIDGMEIALSN